MELIRRAKNWGVAVTAEVTPHHLTLTEEEIENQGTVAKVNPPLRTGRDTEALLRGLKDGAINIIATDHAPHTLADKMCALEEAPFGISGLETALGSLLGLVHTGRLSLTNVIARLTVGPAAIIGRRFGELGALAVGAKANVTIFDPVKEWLVNADTFASKGKNTPLAGRMLKGKVVATVSQGELVYKDESIVVG